MKKSVIIKSFQHGITLCLPHEGSMDEVLEQVSLKFKDSAAFFKNAKMVLSIEGRELSLEEERQIVEAIESNSEIEILCLIGKDEASKKRILKTFEQFQSADGEQDKNPVGQFFKGSLKNGQVLEMDYGIIILGDVNPGATVISKKDIIIIGGLYGNAYAGSGGESGHYVIALDVSPESIRIDEHRYTPQKKSKWPIRPKYKPQIAYVLRDSVIVEPVTRDFTEKI